MWNTSPLRPSETPEPGFRKGGTHPSGLKCMYNGYVFTFHISDLNWNLIEIHLPFINTLDGMHKGSRV